jgi:DNA-binding response OmpR family regulator/DNA-binding CsgD family transcriptional regulator
MKDYKILIIDDQIQTIHTIINYLEKEYTNYHFYHALNGISGIEVAQKHIPDLIVTDWEMPGFSGIETIKTLKNSEKTKDIPVIMLTGIMLDSEHLKTALEAGAIDYIRKPIDKLELTARIKSMLMLADSYKENIALKNRELASTAMNILKHNEFNNKLLKQLIEINNEFGSKNKKLESKLTDLSDNVSFKIKGEAWEQFELYFQNVHPNFFKELAIRFPELTASEIKLAAFLKLNLSTKEISDITFISPNSIKTSRNRLRRKLQLDAKESLVNYLMTI